MVAGSTQRVGVPEFAALLQWIESLDAGALDGRDLAEIGLKGGNLTVGRFVCWVEAMPPGQRIPQQLVQAPDSLVRGFVKSIARQDVMLKKADSAGITMTTEEKQALYGEFRQLVTQLWQQLGIDPKQLADSARNVPERERFAAARVESYLDRVMMGQAQPISVPIPVQAILTEKELRDI